MTNRPLDSIGRARRLSSIAASLALLVLGGLVLAGCQTTGTEASRLTLHRLEHDGVTRTFRVYAPPGARRATGAPLPLVFVLHGWTDSGLGFSETTGYHRLAAREGFIAVFPDGRAQRWRVVEGLARATDDVGFLRAVAAKVDREIAPVDRARIYSVGFSMGGMMSLRLACEAPDLVAGVAAVGGALPAELEDGCKPKRPVSVLLIHGLLDPISHYAGGPLTAPGLPLIPMLSVGGSGDVFARANGCAAEPRGRPSGTPGGSTAGEVEEYPGCKGARVVTWSLPGLGHHWPDPNTGVLGALGATIGATRESWRFFKSVPAESGKAAPPGG